MKKLCCLRLKTAGVVVGSLYLLTYLLGSIHTTYKLVERLGRQEQYRNTLIVTDTVWFHVIGVCVSVALMIPSICLVVGTVKNKQKLLLPWLIVGIFIAIAHIAYAAYLIYWTLTYAAVGLAIELKFFLRPIVIIALFILHAYLWRGIQQLYAEIAEKNRQKKIEPTTGPLNPQHEELN